MLDMSTEWEAVGSWIDITEHFSFAHLKPNGGDSALLEVHQEFNEDTRFCGIFDGGCLYRVATLSTVSSDGDVESKSVRQTA
jgi:hypothetical protein